MKKYIIACLFLLLNSHVFAYSTTNVLKSKEELRTSGFSQIIEAVNMADSDSDQNITFLGVVKQSACSNGECIKEDYAWDWTEWVLTDADRCEYTRTIRCMDSESRETVDDSLCVSSRPADNLIQCTASDSGDPVTDGFKWVSGPVGLCHFNSQSNLVKCSSSVCVNTLTGKTEPDTACGESGKPEDVCVPCSTEDVSYSWKVDEWGYPEDGFCKRTVACITDSGDIVSDTYCDSEEKPDTEQVCETSGSFSWEESLHTCEPVAGKPGLYSYANYVCQDSDTGITVMDSSCISESDKPNVVYIECDLAYPPEVSADWATSSFGECVKSTKKQSRAVYCINTLTGERVGEYNCNSKNKPHETISCESGEILSCDFEWWPY